MSARRIFSVAVGLIFIVAMTLGGQESGQLPTRFLGNDKLPKQILLIRHAEKALDDLKDPYLNAPGKERAAKLHILFAASPDRPKPFPTPDFIFATQNSANSQRPVETVTPLAAKLKLPVNSSYPNNGKGIQALSQEILQNPMYAGKTVLICWRHGTMPELARALKAKGAPKEFPGKSFDHVWQISYQADGKVTFQDCPQQLMKNDSAK